MIAFCPVLNYKECITDQENKTAGVPNGSNSLFSKPLNVIDPLYKFSLF